jgi:hypothetical protein
MTNGQSLIRVTVVNASNNNSPIPHAPVTTNTGINQLTDANGYTEFPQAKKPAYTGDENLKIYCDYPSLTQNPRPLEFAVVPPRTYAKTVKMYA